MSDETKHDEEQATPPAEDTPSESSPQDAQVSEPAEGAPASPEEVTPSAQVDADTPADSGAEGAASAGAEGASTEAGGESADEGGAGADAESSAIDADELAAVMASAGGKAESGQGADGGAVSVDDVEAAMAAMLEGADGSAPANDPAAQAVPFEPPDLSVEGGAADTSQIDLLDDVELDVKIELGRTEMYIEDVLGLGPGSVVELDKAAGDPVDIFVNERLVARGEVLILNDNFCVRVNDIISPVPELEEDK